MRLFIGSANPVKIKDWRDYLPGWEVVSYEDLGMDKVEVEEGIVSLRENAERKARAWAKASGLLTLSDDTGFFVNALGGRPGVSVKRWGGKFQEEMSQPELLRYLRQEIEGLDDLSCYFESTYVLADAGGRVESFTARLPGRLDRTLLGGDLGEGWPLGAYFRWEGNGRVWREMDGAERREAEREVVSKVEELAGRFK